MRVTAGEISKMVQAVLLAEGPSPAVEKMAGRMGRAATRGTRQFPPSISRQDVWGIGDDRRMSVIGRKVIQALREQIVMRGVMLTLSDVERRTIGKMTHDEVVNMIDDALGANSMKIARNIADAIKGDE